MTGRLIDADKITYTNVRVHEGGWCESIEMAYKWDIDAIPTVEAIPIEWIQQYLEKIHTGDIFTDGLVRIHIEDMVDNWQKEHREKEWL